MLSTASALDHLDTVAAENRLPIRPFDPDPQFDTKALRASFPVKMPYGMFVVVPAYEDGEVVLYNSVKVSVLRQDRDGWLTVRSHRSQEVFRVWPHSVRPTAPLAS